MIRFTLPPVWLALVATGCAGAPATPPPSVSIASPPSQAIEPSPPPAGGKWFKGFVPLTDDERKLTEAAGLPDSVTRTMKANGRNLRLFEGRDDDGKTIPGAGLTIDVAADRARSIVETIRKKVGPMYVVFVSEQHYGLAGQADEVSLVRTRDPYQVMLLVQTNGWNHDLSPEDIVRQLQQWDSAFGLIYNGIGYDWLEAEFIRRPPDMKAFADEVYAFCPDVVDQGTGTVEKLAEEMDRTNTLYLWWD